MIPNPLTTARDAMAWLKSNQERLRRVFIVRHGKSLANEQGRIVSDLVEGERSFGLTPEGREGLTRSIGAAKASHALAPTARTVSSPFLRTRETADTICHLLASPGPLVDHRLAERGFGSLNGQPDTRYHEVWEAETFGLDVALFRVEPTGMVLTRVTAVIMAHLNSAENDDTTLIVVTHGDPAMVILAAANGLAPVNRFSLADGPIEPGEVRRLVRSRKP